ncbi:MAG: hypothetical protein IJ248_00470 [Candidatus Methanomethylophilaceae archaeon]|nr:hypothetical protein [Candidatus Methanomethylophilaceae archaeon]
MAVMSDSNLAYTEDVKSGLRDDGYVQFQKDGVNTMLLIDVTTGDRLREILLNIELAEAFRRSEEDGDNMDAFEFLESLRNE